MQAKAVNSLIYGYADDMLDDLFFDKETALQNEIDEDIEREDQRP